MEPTVKALAQEGCAFNGVLYGGLMLTEDGPKVIEFNCRMGDPETQVIMPRLKTDLVEILLSIARGTLNKTSIKWSTEACVGVAMASTLAAMQRGCQYRGWLRPRLVGWCSMQAPGKRRKRGLR